LSVLFSPVGSDGDIRPLLWLAGGMAARGHRVTFLITPYYQHLVPARGWRSWPVGTAEEFAQLMRDPRLWQPRHGSELVIRYMLETLPRYHDILEEADERFDLVVGTTIATGALTWAERRRIPRLLTHLAPMCVRSAYDCPLFLEGLEWLCAAPPWGKRAMFWLFDLAVARQSFGPVNAHRAKLGLAPLRHVNEQLWHGADGVAALFPDWFAAPQRDWPKHLRQFGFPRETATPSASLSSELENFLAAGAPPILWTHGSANLDTDKFSKVARSATAALGARGLLIGPAFAAAPSASPDFLTLPHAPFAQLFPRGCALVHHGGIGTTAQALAAGLPQLVVPRSHDQPDNARRLTRLGVGAGLAYGRLTADTAAAALRGLLDSPVTRAACASYQKKILSDDPLPRLCDWAEELAR
jgi:rhamnosyltransferase subunit B